MFPGIACPGRHHPDMILAGDMGASVKRLAISWGFSGALALGLGLQPAHAVERLALVIGNSQYQAAPDLRNAGNDATDVAAKLKTLGFTLIGDRAHLEVTRAQMARLIRDLGNAAQPGSEVLFYYAGHGIAGDNDNWLLPVDDADIKVQEDVPDFAVSARSVLSRMEQRGSGVNVVILDACRNNPLPDRKRSVGGTRGLTRMTAPLGSFIAYSASPGQAAADGDGRNGLFTAALLSLMDQPQLRIDDLFAEVGKKVRVASSGAQVPIRETNLEEVYYFRRQGAAAVPQVTAALPLPVPAPAPQPAPSKPVEVAMAGPVATTATPEEEAAYLAAFDMLKAGRYNETIQGFSNLNRRWPRGQYAANAWFWTGETYYITRDYSAALAAFQEVVENFPQSPKRPDAMLKIGLSQLGMGQAAAGRQTLERLTRDFPQSNAAKLAQKRLEN